MSDIVERLRDYASDDHERLCGGREYTCSCGYDEKRDPLITEAADTIIALRAENERLRSALIPFACRCARKGKGAGGTCLAPGGICSSWNARAALEGKHD